MRMLPSTTRIASRRRAVTLSETLVTAAVVGVLLFLVALGVDGIRNELKRRQTMSLLETLDAAMLAHHESTGAWPVDATPARLANPSRQPEDVEDPEENLSGDRVIAVIAEVPAGSTILQTIPDVLRVKPSEQPRKATTQPALGLVRDSWGRPFCCLTSASSSPAQRKAVAANGGRPIFISAGPDGRLGLLNVAAASDNLRSDELQK